MVQNYLISSNIVYLLHTFQKVKYLFHDGNFAFSSIKTVHVLTTVYYGLHYNILIKCV